MMAMYFVSVDGNEHNVEVRGNDRYLIDGVEQHITFSDLGQGRYSAIVNGRSVVLCAPESGIGESYLVNGRAAKVVVESQRQRLLKSLHVTQDDAKGSYEVRAPMPALVSSVIVNPGDGIIAGQGLITLEAMKMENEIKAQRDGVVREVLVTKGRSVEKGELLIVFDKSKGSDK